MKAELFRVYSPEEQERRMEISRAFAPAVGPELYACALCEDTRFVRVTQDKAHPLFGEAVPCVCAREHRIEDLRRRSGIPSRYLEMSFDTFNPRQNVHAYEMALAWDGATNVVLAGMPGRGKTHLGTAMLAREIDRRLKPGYFAYVPSVLDEIRRRYADDATENAADYEQKLARWPLLLLDDLGAERATAWAVERLTLLLEERQDASLVTIVTTNLMSREAIEAHFRGPRGEAEIEASRLASRLGPGRYQWIAAAGEDMREYERVTGTAS